MTISLDNKNTVTDWLNKNSIKGFLAEQEGEALYEYASSVMSLGAGLEIGSYCGKSTIYLAAAYKKGNQVVFAVDHHRGSEEHQLGEEYHDSELYNSNEQMFDSFPYFRRTIDQAGLSRTVIPVVTQSEILMQHWTAPLSLVFIDGGHSPEMAMRDCLSWSERVAPGGILAVHDIFEHPEEGGQGPYWGVQEVLKNNDFVLEDKVQSLGFLRRLK